MITFPHAKINLGLYITGERPDGFHDIETVFYPVPLCDILEITASKVKNTVFAATGRPVPGDPGDNLVLKAYHFLASRYALPPVSIHLHKIIPMGSGLGGGSSDAAFVLKMLNEIFSLAINDEQMEAFASRLGSDCAFFIKGKPVLASGRGDRFSQAGPDLSGFHIRIVVPQLHVSTAEAYSMTPPQKPEKDLLETVTGPVETWKEGLFNAFETTVFRKYPEIGQIKKKLYEAGAVYASMSGSGSAVFGLSHEAITLPEEFGGYFTWQGILP